MALVIVLVVVLGGIALRRVADRSEGRRESLPASVDDEAVRGPSAVDDVAIVGDSITVDSEKAFHAALDDQYRLRVRGRGGYRIEEMEPYAIELAVEDPEQVIINLGTNDVLQNGAIDKSVTALNRMIKDFSKVACFFVVNLNEGMRRDSDPDVAGRAEVFNLELNRIAESSNLKVIDWNGAIEADQAAGSPNGELLTDTIHPSPAGQAVLAKLYKDALASCRP